MPPRTTLVPGGAHHRDTQNIARYFSQFVPRPGAKRLRALEK
jgi:hypothetical protein